MSKEIVRMEFGSTLYGTSTPSSDTDYKGVYLVPLNNVLLGKVPKSKSNNTGNDSSKNTADDIDIEIYSLHYFIKLACEGQTVALDMLHAPLDFVEHYTDEWKFIVDNRDKFYTKNLKAFVGYARKQAAKYSCRGSRLNTIDQVLKILKENN
jgi:predicted nucleotidyltransferase